MKKDFHERQQSLLQGAKIAKFAQGLPETMPAHKLLRRPITKDPGGLADLIAEIQVLERLLGWDKAKRADFLKANFNVPTRSRLSDADLIYYRRLLRIELKKAGRWVYVAS